MNLRFPLTILIGLLLVSPTMAADDPPPADDPTNLDSLLEGLPDEPAPAQPSSTKPQPTKPADPQEAIRIEGEDLGQPSGEDNPLASIPRQMQQVKRRIGGGDTADETQFMQKQIVSDLDKLLEQLNKQCQGGQCKKPGQKPPSKPGAGKPKGGSQPGQKSNRPSAQGSEEGTRKAESVEETAADPQAVAREAWGHLPQRLREQVQAAAFERFLPEYEGLIEAYYQRLAEENASP